MYGIVCRLAIYITLLLLLASVMSFFLVCSVLLCGEREISVVSKYGRQEKNEWEAN